VARIRSFVIEHNDDVIEPWKGVKDLHGYEWIKDGDLSVVVEVRDTIQAYYSHVDVHRPIYVSGERQPIDYIDFAVFQSIDDGKTYDISRRLADKSKVKKGDYVMLKILGCCSIMSVNKREETK